MKNILLSLTMALTALGGVTNAAQAETLVLYDFTGTPRNSPAALPSVTTPPPAGVVPSNFTRGPGLGNTTTVTTGFLDANQFAGTSTTSPGTRAQAIAGNDYFTFSIAAAPGSMFTLDTLSFNTGRSSTGPTTYFAQAGSNTGGFTPTFTSADFVVPIATTPTGIASTNFGSNFVNITTPVEFRIYGFGATASTGVGRIDNVRLEGQVAAVPEPSTYALFAIGLGGIAFALRRKKEAEGEGATVCAEMGGSGLRTC